MLVSSFVLLAAIALLRRFGHARWLTWAVQIGCLSLVVLTGIQIGLTQITGEGVNGAVFYHMRTGLEGGDISQYAGSMIAAVLAVAGVGAGLWWGRRWLRPGALTRNRAWDIAILSLVIGALALHPVSTATASYALRFAMVDQQSQGFVDPELDPDGPEQPRNLVILYLESLERTYLDDSRFAGLTPRLSALEGQAMSFTDIGQTTGAGFTVGGMVASQCGVPLILSGGANSMRVSRFLSGATCLGDILSEADYTLSYLGGASVEFAGKGAFYESHAYDQVTGLDQLLPTLDDPDYIAEWGLQDDTLFDLARERFDTLSEAGSPFVLTLLTLDTHHPNGHADTNRACAGMRFGDGDNPMLNSVQCADHLAGQFIEDILSGPNGDNTVIAVMSDHLAMVNSVTDLLTAGPRRNLFMILDRQTDQPGRTIDRRGTTLDIGPTLLSYLGFDVPRMGLGADLLGASPTLPETLDVAADDQRALNNHVMGFQSVYARLWAYPDLSDGLYANTEAGQVQFGHSRFRLPALFAFDEGEAISQATLGDLRAQETLSQTALNLPAGTRYFWFDDCHALGLMAPEAGMADQDGLCLLTGDRTTGAALHPLTQSRFFSRQQLVEMLTNATAVSAEQEADGLIRIGQARGDLPLPITISSLATGERGILLQSSAFGAGASFVRRQTTESLEAGEDWVLQRGLSLIGIGPDGRAEILDRLDQCATGFDPASHSLWADQIDASRDRFIAHILAVHDTAFCGPEIAPITPVLQGLSLPELRASEMREPYLAVIGPDHRIAEFANRHFPRLRVFLDPLAEPVVAEEPAAAPGQATIAAAPAALARAEPSRQVEHEDDVVEHRVVAIAAPAAETRQCIVPTPPASPAPVAPLQIGQRISGGALAGPIGFPTGWRGQEPGGLWMGSRDARLTLVLPETANDLQLTLELAVPGSRNIQLAFEGRILTQTTLSGRDAISARLTGVPRGQPVTFDLIAGGDALTCPSAQGSGTDPRQMAAMLIGAMLGDVIADEPAPFQALATPVPAVPAEAVAVEEGCQPPSAAQPPLPAETALPVDRIVPLAEAMATRGVSFAGGWWPQEEFGRWMGAEVATFEVVLPDQPASLSLAVATAAFESDTVDVAVSYQGTTIGRQQTGINAPLVIDVSTLPRGRAIPLVLSLQGATLACPAAREISDDSRTLGLMVQSLRLRATQPALFGRSVAHGGGRLGGIAISNSFEAMAANLARFDVFEIDFSWTADGELVCLHDWQDSFTSRFGAATDSPLDLGQFRQLLAASPDQPRNCDLDGLAGWMRANPNILIVTDVKSDPAAAHEIIATRHPDILAQFVPQAYQPEEIALYRELGFKQVIWTLYRFGSDPDRVIEAALAYRPDALTMPLAVAEDGLLGAVTRATGMPVYVHTINDRATAACLLRQGATGIYSDDLGTEDLDQLMDLSTPCQQDPSQ